MAASVAMPLERSLGRIAGVSEMTSSSGLGSTRIVLQFDLDRDINAAAREVQAAINAARGSLPAGIGNNPSYRKVNPSVAPIMIIGLTSDTMTQGQMYDAASTIIAPKLSQLDGVGQVQVGGSSLPAVRVEINPRALFKYGIGFEDVRAALAAQNANRPKGAFGRRRTLLADRGQRSGDDGRRFRSTGHRLSQRRRRAIDRCRAKSSIPSRTCATQGRPTASRRCSSRSAASPMPTSSKRPIASTRSCRCCAPRYRGRVDLAVTMDRTTTIRASMRDAERTLAISVVLVVLVVFVFLRNFRAALIPSVAVPVSLITTFGIMHLCGYSLNNVTLMALAIAAGFVVDDAIVVLENTVRHIENGMAPQEAARVGAGEVGFTVVAMTLALVSVFIPMLLMGGFVGMFFREFAVTLSAAILVSLLVSLTTTPMMCARLLEPEKERRSHRPFAPMERTHIRGPAARLRTDPGVGARSRPADLAHPARDRGSSTSFST